MRERENESERVRECGVRVDVCGCGRMWVWVWVWVWVFVYTYSAHLGIEKACSKVVGDRHDEALYLRALRARGRLACLLHLQFDV